MTRHRKSFPSEIASEFRKVNQANAEYASLVRELEYPAIRERIRSPPIPLHLVLLGLLNTLLFIAVRFPLHVLKRFGPGRSRQRGDLRGARLLPGLRVRRFAPRLFRDGVRVGRLRGRRPRVHSQARRSRPPAVFPLRNLCNDCLNVSMPQPHRRHLRVAFSLSGDL